MGEGGGGIGRWGREGVGYDKRQPESCLNY